MDKDKILIIAGMQSWPPIVGGTPTIMYNLFEGLNTDKFDVLTGKVKNYKTDNKILHFKTYSFLNSKLHNYKLLWRIGFFFDCAKFVYNGFKIIKKEPDYKRLFILFPDTASFIGGYILAKVFKIKFDVYLLDLLSESRILIAEKFFLSLFQKRILNDAVNVFVMSSIQDYYAKSIPRKYITLTHCIDYDFNIKITNYFRKNTIAYAGQIHSNVLDALQILVKAIGSKLENRITLQIYSNINHEQYKKFDLDYEFVQLKYIFDHGSLINELGKFELLYSPIAFHAPYPEQSATCFPTKTFDYIQAGRPILVHAAGDYYYTKYMKYNNAAFISTSQNPEQLIIEIIKIIGDHELQDSYVNNSLNLAKKNHSRSRLQKIFIEKLKDS